MKHAAGAHRLTAALTAAAVPATGGLLIGAVVISHPSPHGPSAGPGATVPGWHTSAAPIPGTSLIARTVTHGKARRAARGEAGVAGPGVQPVYGTGPASSSSPPSSAAPAVQVTGTLQVTADGLSLGAGTGLSLGAGDGTDLLTATFTVTADGGPASFGVISSRSSDVAVSPASGSLQAGESATVTVSVSVAAELLGGDVTVRVWGGSGSATVIPVSWLAALVPSVVPSPVASITAGVLPSGL